MNDHDHDLRNRFGPRFETVDESFYESEDTVRGLPVTFGTLALHGFLTPCTCPPLGGMSLVMLCLADSSLKTGQIAQARKYKADSDRLLRYSFIAALPMWGLGILWGLMSLSL